LAVGSSSADASVKVPCEGWARTLGGKEIRMTPSELCVSDTIKLLIEKAREARLSARNGSGYESGVAFALYECVSLLHQQAQVFGISPEHLGFPADFDPERELLWHCATAQQYAGSDSHPAPRRILALEARFALRVPVQEEFVALGCAGEIWCGI
jgi:hypothetical protein